MREPDKGMGKISPSLNKEGQLAEGEQGGGIKL
jgi:hypothetical protein